jgi:metallo-beta-lactamase class B
MHQLNFRTLLLAVVCYLPLSAAFSQVGERRDIDFQAEEPFQVFDNLYFVGIKAVASYVIETSDGLILIDTLDGFDGFTDRLLANIRTVGLDPADIKYVLILQSHRDHYGGARELQAEIDAVFGSGEEDWQVIESDLGELAPRRDMVLEDGGSLRLGDTTLNFEHTPGHTPGATSMRFSVFDNGQEHLAYFHGGSALRTDEPAAIQRFIDDLERIRTIPGIEVQIINHDDIHASGADDLWTRAERLKNRQPGETHPWVAPDEFQRWLDELIADSYRELEQAQ